MLDYILDIIYPNVCGFCNNICNENLCTKCEEKINKLLLCNIDDYKNDNSKYFEEHIYLFKYDNEIRENILDYKFNDKSYLYKTFAKIINKNKKICGFLKKYDIIIPVPIHKKRLDSREKKVLIKAKNTNPQSTLTKEERIKNTQNVYILKNIETIKNKKIVLFDDIYTTGSTVNECSKLLKENGAKEIGILTLAKD